FLTQTISSLLTSLLGAFCLLDLLGNLISSKILETFLLVVKQCFDYVQQPGRSKNFSFGSLPSQKKELYQAESAARYKASLLQSDV
ncbi:hypothetical protein, partial [Nostoc sp. ChiQUE01b]|uniref:hypothetical protein n=1 Tax=Nostoc sp. ChiQUE01b TaxID=3075376 RepID=UPI002AD5A52C